MTTQTVSGKLCTRGPKGSLEIPLSTSVTDGTATEIKTDSTVTVTTQGIGVYGENQVLTGGFLSAKTGFHYAAIFNNGIVRATIPMYSRTSGCTGGQDTTILNQIKLVPGDQLLVVTYA